MLRHLKNGPIFAEDASRLRDLELGALPDSSRLLHVHTSSNHGDAFDDDYPDFMAPLAAPRSRCRRRGHGYVRLRLGQRRRPVVSRG